MIGQTHGSNGVNARIYTPCSVESTISDGELVDFSIPSSSGMNIWQRLPISTVKTFIKQYSSSASVRFSGCDKTSKWTWHNTSHCLSGRQGKGLLKRWVNICCLKRRLQIKQCENKWYLNIWLEAPPFDRICWGRIKICFEQLYLFSDLQLHISHHPVSKIVEGNSFNLL